MADRAAARPWVPATRAARPQGLTVADHGMLLLPSPDACHPCLPLRRPKLGGGVTRACKMQVARSHIPGRLTLARRQDLLDHPPVLVDFSVGNIAL